MLNITILKVFVEIDATAMKWLNMNNPRPTAGGIGYVNDFNSEGVEYLYWLFALKRVQQNPKGSFVGSPFQSLGSMTFS